MSVALDTGALIALERDDRAIWAALKVAASSGVDVLVPSSALAQVWRGSPRQTQLARALQHCVIAPFDGRARAVGELCGRAGTREICDAHVALVAADCECLFTSDPHDLRKLLFAIRKRIPTIVRC